MDNIREYFGSFEISTSRVQFNPALYQKYINDMIPGLAGRRTMVKKAKSPKEEGESDDDQSHDSEDETSDSEDEKQSMHSEESAKSSELQQSTLPHIRLERIDVKQHESNRVLKRIAKEPLTNDEPARKSMRLNGKNGRETTVDLSIEPDTRLESSESDTDDSEQEENFDEFVESNEAKTCVNNELIDPAKLRIENNDQDKPTGSDEIGDIEDDEEKTDEEIIDEEENAEEKPEKEEESDNEKDDEGINDGEKGDKDKNDGEEIDEEESDVEMIDEDKTEKVGNVVEKSNAEQNDDMEVNDKEIDGSGDAYKGENTPKALAVETVSNDTTESLQRNPTEDSAATFDRAIGLLTQAFQKANEERNHAIEEKLKFERLCNALHARVEKLQQENTKLGQMNETRMCSVCKHTAEEEM